MTKPLFIRLFFAAILALILLLPTGTETRAELIDRVVAIVNDAVITLSELNNEGRPLFQRIEENAPPEERELALQQAREDILTRLIESQLMLQKAADLGMEVGDEEVAQTVTRIIEKNNLTREQFLRDLKRIGTDEDNYRQSIRKQIIESRLTNMEIHSKIVVTDEQIRDYYDTKYVQQEAPDGFNLLQIGLSWAQKGRSADKEEAKKRAFKLQKKAEEGGDFRELARANSDMPSARDGGAIGSFVREELAPYMREAILTLKPGQVSQVVETDAGYQFFKLLSVKEGDMVAQAPFYMVKEDIREIIYNQELEKLYKNWTEQLREKAYIKRTL